MSLAASSSGWRLLAACREPESHQRTLLAQLVRRHARTAFAREHQLSPRMGPRDFASAVPVRDYAALGPWLRRALAGEPNVLVADPVPWFVRSSGTMGAPKLLPLTRQGVRAFQRARDRWLERTLALYPAASRAELFALASPADEEPIGTHAVAIRQSALSWVPARAPMARALTPPASAEVDGAGSASERERRLLDHAIGRDLSMIGATSPSSLLAFFDALARRGDGLSVRRAWPRLALCACWTAGPSALYLPRLAARTEGLPVHDVGLCSSEGYFALPVEREAAAVLSADLYVIELLEEGAPAAGPVPWAALERGREYRLVVTTPNGLWRYDTEDIVEVCDTLERCPTVAFRRRAGAVVSIAGEKVTEWQVVEAVRAVAAEHAFVVDDFVCRLLWPAEGPPRYRFELTLEREAGVEPALAARLDVALAALNGEYRMRREQGRLGPVEAVGRAGAPLRPPPTSAVDALGAATKPRHLLLGLPPRPPAGGEPGGL